MMYSFRIEQAIRAASILHEGVSRRGSAPYPYASHLYSVAWIVADYTTDEDVIVAALLHDALEYTDYTGDELALDFGPRVRELVESVSEHAFRADTDSPWYERKRAYVDALLDAPTDALLVAAADAIHNLRTIVEEYQGNLSGYEADFGGTLDERGRIYERIAAILNGRLEGGIIDEFNHVFGEYKDFINGSNTEKE